MLSAPIRTDLAPAGARTLPFWTGIARSRQGLPIRDAIPWMETLQTRLCRGNTAARCADSEFLLGLTCGLT